MRNCDIFTPKNISILMNSYLNQHGTLLEPSVGTGNLLMNTSGYSRIDVFDTNKDFLDSINSDVSKFNTDFLKFNFTETYDNIISNPPYIKFQDLTIDERKFIKKEFPILSSNFDIFMAFILKCVSVLKENGIFVCIVPSSVLFNNNSKKLMNYLFEKKIIKKIIDFKSEKVFDKINVYCCILVIQNTINECFYYNEQQFFYSALTEFTLNKISGETIENYIKISNGIATLADKVFIHDNKLNDEKIWKRLFKVSKNSWKWIIYPYENKKIITEEYFKNNYPETYIFLLSKKEDLAHRDRGNKKYEAWFAFGRRQGIKNLNAFGVNSTNLNTEKNLFIPSMSNINYPIYELNDCLFYSGLCITATGNKNLQEIKLILDNQNNRNLLYSMSSKRGSDWFNISSSSLKKLIV